MFDRFTELASNWLVHRRTVLVLRGLSPHELEDIGLSRVPTGEFYIPIHGYFGNASYRDFAESDLQPSPEIAARQEIEVTSPTPDITAVRAPSRPRRRSPQVRKAVGAGA